MSCCGGKRTELRSSLQTSSNVKQTLVTPAAPGVAARATAMGGPAAPADSAPPRAAVQAQVGLVTLRYLAWPPIQVVGPVTRAMYRFSREAPLQRIARADAGPLLASGYFQQET